MKDNNEYLLRDTKKTFCPRVPRLYTCATVCTVQCSPVRCPSPVAIRVDAAFVEFVGSMIVAGVVRVIIVEMVVIKVVAFGVIILRAIPPKRVLIKLQPQFNAYPS